MPKFKDDKISVIKSDIERLRKRTSMYISNKGSKGALHLCRELINNAFDEAMSDDSPCNAIDIIFDGNLNQLTVVDNGRGIQFDKVEILCTYLHSGSNIDKAEEKANAAELAGENGVGLTAVNSLSSKFCIVVHREGKKGTFIFDDAKMQKPIFEKCDENKHGTAVLFVPSEEYLGKCKIDPNALAEWIDMISYTLPSQLKIHLHVIKKGKETPVVTTFHHPKGIEELFDNMVEKSIIKPIRLTIGKDRFEDKKTHCDVILSFADGDVSDAGNHQSFCNRVVTIDDGTHVDALKNAWCRAVLKITRELLSEADKKKLDIKFEDCRTGLAFIIAAYIPSPGFTGQTKQKLDNDELYKPLSENLYTDILKYLRDNPLEAKKIATFIKNTAKSRQNAVKVRKSDYRGYDTFEEAVLKAYLGCKSNKYKEIWLLEGDSSIGNFQNARDSIHQAGFKLKGNPKNVYGCTLADVLANPELRELTKHLGCGIGKDFDISKLKFDKIILFFDSDIDAYNMVSLICVYLLCCIPEVVKAGKVYRAMGPLYIVKDSKTPYLITKAEYYSLFADNVCTNMKLIDSHKHELTFKEMKQLIEDNKDYLDELLPIVHYYTVNNEIIEFALVHGHKSNFGKLLKVKFPELKYDEKNEVIEGSYAGTDQYLEIGNGFYDRCTRLSAIIHEVNNNDIYYTMIDAGKKYPDKISLGTFFLKNMKYLPKVVKRIKGVGELPDDVLWETTLNPAKRELIQLTIADLEQELKTVKLLHGPDSTLRKGFMDEYIFNREDIDT